MLWVTHAQLHIGTGDKWQYITTQQDQTIHTRIRCTWTLLMVRVVWYVCYYTLDCYYIPLDCIAYFHHNCVVPWSRVRRRSSSPLPSPSPSQSVIWWATTTNGYCNLHCSLSTAFHSQFIKKRNITECAQKSRTTGPQLATNGQKRNIYNGRIAHDHSRTVSRVLRRWRIELVIWKHYGGECTCAEMIDCRSDILAHTHSWHATLCSVGWCRSVAASPRCMRTERKHMKSIHTDQTFHRSFFFLLCSLAVNHWP